MRQHRTPSYRHHKPTNRAVVTINGRDVYLGQFNSPASRAEYDRIIAEWLANGRAAAGSDDPSIAEVLLAFVEWAEKYYVKGGKQTSQVGTVKHAVRPVRELYGDASPRALSVQSLKAVRQVFVDSGLARSEVNRRTKVVVQAFAWGVTEGIVPADVVVALKMLPPLLKGRTDAPERPPVGPVDDAAVDAVLPFLSAPVRAMVELQRWTGARPGEIIIMRTCDIVRDGSNPGSWYTPGSHKTEHHDKERRIYLGPRSREVVAPWLRPDDPDAFLFSPRTSIVDLAERRRTGRHINRRRRATKTGRRVGEKFSVDSYRRAITIGIEKANMARATKGEPPIAHWHPHQIRHSVADRINHDFGREAARAALGHSDDGATKGYLTRDMVRAAEVMEQIG